MRGISKQGTITSKTRVTHAIERVLDALTSFSGYDIDEVILLYTHPDTLFFKKTIGLQTIKKRPRDIYYRIVAGDTAGENTRKDTTGASAQKMRVL